VGVDPGEVVQREGFAFADFRPRRLQSQ
jgi:hypothetical protein